MARTCFPFNPGRDRPGHR